jgi:hypothetical protein
MKNAVKDYERGEYREVWGMSIIALGQRLTDLPPRLPWPCYSLQANSVVGIYKSLSESARELRTPIKLTGNSEMDQLLGSIHLKTRL